MVVAKFGDQVLEKIRLEAGVNEEFFISNQTYDDKITYDLVQAASKVLELPIEELLKAFGHHWVLVTATKGYGPMMDAAGRDFESFMMNLPTFHARVVLIYPQLRPPRFVCSKTGDRQLELQYESDRQGLVPFVFGLVEGIAMKFDCKVLITPTGSQQAQGSFTLRVQWEPNARGKKQAI